MDDRFQLYDLRVETVATDRPFVCGHRAGDVFEVHGEQLIFPAGQPFSMYALAALLPLLPAKQRMTHSNDWMTTDTDIACPDPHCGARFRITRTGVRTFRHSEVTVVPLDGDLRAMAGTGVRPQTSMHASGAVGTPGRPVVITAPPVFRLDDVAVPQVPLAPGYQISSVLKGGWQLAGGHGAVVTEAALTDMAAFVEAGVTTFDCADIYTGVESLIGAFLAQRRASGSLTGVQVHTKCVPDLDALPTLTRTDVEALVDRSLRRLGVERLDLVQLHWWDDRIPGAVQAAQWLHDCQRTGKIRHVGLTNFDTAHVQAMVSAGVPIVSHQVQYSVLDRRAAGTMTDTCARQGIGLLCYGAVAGGFLSERWLGRLEPQGDLENRSLVKYKLIIDEFGGWALFQRLLEVLAAIARKHEASLSAVAIRWVLDQPAVSGVIVGARHARHLPDTLQALRLRLDAEDRAAIAAVHESAHGPNGDVYGLERIPAGRHAAIMRYNLNRS
jgi:uncharacterized repeat protein (TIGR04076 family)